MKKINAIMIIAIVAILFGCKQTHLVKTWYDKQKQNISYNKVLVVGLFKNDVHRTTFEANLAYELDHSGKHFIPAYKVTPKPDGLYKKDTIIKAVHDTGADWVMVSFFKGIKNRYNKIQGEVEYRFGSIEYSDPNYYRHMGFNNFYAFTVDQIIKDAYIQVDTIIVIETVIYSVKDQKIIWMGISETKNAQTAKDITKDLADLIISDLEEHKIIK